MESIVSRYFWLAAITAHAFVAAGWWWMMPGGFPVGHPRFWVNRVFPIIIFGVAIAARVVTSKKNDSARRAAMLTMFPAAWLTGAIAARLIFPISFEHLWLAGLLPAGLMCVAWWPMRRTLVQRRVLSAICMLAGVTMAIVGVAAQRGSDPLTRPMQVAIPQPSASLSTPPNMRSIRLNDAFSVEPGMAVVNVRTGPRMFISVQPLLTFISRSPDRCWILFARRADRTGPLRQLVDLTLHGEAADLTYRDDTTTTLHAEAFSERVEIDAFAQLSHEVYSHLNTYCELTITGHRKLEIAFSPCPSERIEVTYGEYPRGKPRRCAYLASDGVFRVVEATSGEKGPFHTLAEGRLRRDEPLEMTFFDQASPVAVIRFDDFAAQADTSLSPTAGWGLPCNGIEFGLQSESPTSAASVFVSLAGTSIGRGFDTVGHAPGTYRNRMSIKIEGSE